MSFETDQINNEIGSILYDLQTSVIQNVRRYHVEEIINIYLTNNNGKEIIFGGHEFVFSQRKATSFTITDKNEMQNEIILNDSIHQFLFGSVSYVTFPNAFGKVIKFHLARIKPGYIAHMIGGESISLNCYAECLDISAILIDSAGRRCVEYNPVTIRSLM